MSYAARVSSPRRGWRRAASLAAFVVTVSGGVAAPALSRAQTAVTDKAAALKAFEEGLDLEKKGDYAAALSRFQKAGEFKMTPHVRFHIALCDEKLGHLVAAVRGFELAEAEANKMGKDAQVVADKAPGRAEALRKRIAAVRVEVKGRILYSRVLLDGQPIAQKDFSTLVSVDPGPHKIEVETDGAIAQKRELTLPEKGYETITLEIDDPEKPAPTATAAASTSAPPPPPPPPAPPSKLPAFVLGGAGVAAFIGAGVLYGLREGALGQINPTSCPPNAVGKLQCPLGLQGTYDDARTFTTGAGVMVGVGILAVGGAAGYWFFTQRAAKNQPQAPAVGVSVGPTSIRLVGAF